MKLYNDDDPAPNPRRVRIFLLEKGLEIPLVRVPLAEGKHKAPEFLAKNSLGQLPVLELDDGTALAESVSICRYLEALHPEPRLFGRTPAEIGRIDMWIRRIEFRVMLPAGMIWVHAHPFTAAYAASQGRPQFKEFGESNLKVFAGACRWLGREIAGRPFIAGDAYSMADIILQTTLDFGAAIGIDLPDDCKQVSDWYARVSARPSAVLDLKRFPVELARKGLGK
ncbi:MAG: glutathione S-transferase family protein [Myxococcota bacterium]